MKFYLTNRGGGKTTQALLESQETGYTLVTYPAIVDSYKKKHLHSTLKGLENINYNKIPEPISFKDFLGEKYRGKDIKGFIIDDLTGLFDVISHYTISTVYGNLNRFKMDKVNVEIGEDEIKFLEDRENKKKQ